MDLSGRRPAPSSRRRRTRWTLAGLALALVVLAAAVTGLYRRDGDPALYPPPPGEGIQIHILDNGFHTDLVLPRDAVEAGRGPLAAAVRRLPPGERVYIGWGDARFFVEEGPVSGRWTDGLRALVARDNPSVVRLYAGGLPTASAQAPVQGLWLSRAGLQGLVARVDRSLATDAGGAPVLVQVRASDGAWFFASREAFWIGHLCNHWTIEALSAAGITVWPWRPMTSGEVLRTVRRAKARAAALDLGRQPD